MTYALRFQSVLSVRWWWCGALCPRMSGWHIRDKLYNGEGMTNRSFITTWWQNVPEWKKKRASILHQIWHVLSPGWQGDKMCRNRDSSGNSQTTDCILDSVSYREIHVSSPVIPCLFLSLRWAFATWIRTTQLYLLVVRLSTIHLAYRFLKQWWHEQYRHGRCRSELRQSWISRVVTLGSTLNNVFAASLFVSVSVRHAGLCRTCDPAFCTKEA